MGNIVTAVAAEPVPASHLSRIHALGLEVITYRHAFVTVSCGDRGQTCREVLPRDIIGPHGTLITFRTAERPYDIDGYEAYRHAAAGGRHRTIHDALDWVEWIDRQVAARAKSIASTALGEAA